MKEIKITSKNMEAIESVLAEANGKSKVRLAHWFDVTAYIKIIEQKLASKGLPNKSWVGMKFYVQPQAENMPNAYFKKGNPSATAFIIVRKATGWFLLEAKRDTFYDGRKIRLLTVFNDDQKSHIIDNAYKF